MQPLFASSRMRQKCKWETWHGMLTRSQVRETFRRNSNNGGSEAQCTTAEKQSSIDG